MNIHKNAPLTPKGREAMVRGWKPADAEGRGEAAGDCPQTVAKWVERFAARASMVCAIAPRGPSLHRPTACTCHRRRGFAPAALHRQADCRRDGVSPATVSRILRRLGLTGSRRWNRPNRCAVTSANIPAN